MLLFKKAYWEGLVSGAITLTFRRWKRSHVRPGGRYRCHPIGVLQVDDVQVVRLGTITARDASRAGFASRDELVAYLAALGPLEDDTEVHRVELHFGGDGDRVASALDEELTAEEVAAVVAALARMDGKGPWTAATLEAIEKHPRVAASKLALQLGRETAPFKADVVRLKKLGLTQSFEVGYEITPRGRAYLEATRKRAGRATRPKRKSSTKARASSP